MRIIDDLVDDRKAAGGPLTETEVRQYEVMMRDWIGGIRRGRPTDDFQRELLDMMRRFAIPPWPWERLSKAMTYDLHHDAFATFQVFRRYAEGAAVAPASVFMHLCGIRSEGEGYTSPMFDIARAARPLALFSYLTHIIRDFQKDHQRGLNYFPLALLQRHKVTVDQLRMAADGGAIPGGLREIVAQYLSWISYYREWSLRQLAIISPNLSPQYRLSLALIYGLYQQIVDRVDPASGRFTTEELNPTPSEVRARIEEVVNQQQDNEL
jgi:phytoene synthase